MANITQNLTALAALVFVIVGAAITMLGIFKANETGDKTIGDDYIIPSQVLNALTVMFLLYLTASNTSFSASYKLLIIFLLVGGLVLEIYLTNYSDSKSESVASYVFITMNFLVRTFFIIELSQSEWTQPFTKPVLPIQKAVKETISDIVAPSASLPKSTPDVPKDTYRELRDKWDKLRGILKARPEGLNVESESEAWKSVIRPGLDQKRTDIVATLKEAVSKLKDKEGNPIPLNSVDSVGGKRRS